MAEGADRVLSQQGYEIRLLVTTGPGHAQQLAAEAAGTVDLVVAAGGDGTAHEVACGLLGTDCPLVVIPAGSGNDLARGLGCGSEELALAAIVAGRERLIDAWALDDAPFFNSVGLLASGLVSGKAARYWRGLGGSRYVLASLMALLTYRGQQVTWDFPEGEPTSAGRYFLAEACNGPTIGGGIRLVQGADLSDGLLDVCLIRPVGLGTGLRLLPRAIRGRPLNHPAVSYHRCSGMAFQTSEPFAVHLDGEPGVLPAGRHVLQALPDKLKVLVGNGPDGPAIEG